MSCPMNSESTPSAISSPVSEGGALPCAKLGGLTLAQFGRDLAPANLSARQAKALGLLTSGISGRVGFTSSRSASLRSSLESRLKMQLPMGGLTLFEMTWKAAITPSQQRVCLLRASARDTIGDEFGSLPTPTKPSNTKGHQAGNNRFITKMQRIFGGKLNPRAVGWMMGFPAEWSTSAPTATRSSRKSPPPSSKATSGPTE